MKNKSKKIIEKWIASFVVAILICNTNVFASEIVRLADYNDEGDIVQVMLETVPVEEAVENIPEEALQVVQERTEAFSEEMARNIASPASEADVEDEYAKQNLLVEKLADVYDDGTLSVNILTDLEYAEESACYKAGDGSVYFSLERRVMHGETSVVELIDEDEADALIYMMLSEDEAQELETKWAEETVFEYDGFSFEWPLEKTDIVEATGGFAKIDISSEFMGCIYYFVIDDRGIRSASNVILIKNVTDSVEVEMPKLSEAEEVSLDDVVNSEETEKPSDVLETPEDSVVSEVNEDALPEEHIEELSVEFEEPTDSEFVEEPIQEVYEEEAARQIRPLEENLLDIDEEDDEIISVSVPTSFNVIMLPYEDGTIMVLAEDIVMKNNGQSDVVVNISNIAVNILKDNVDSNSKTCNLQMVIVDANGEHTIDLVEGDNPDVYSGLILDALDGTEGNVVLKLSGRVVDGSNDYWRSGDLKITITYDIKHKSEISDEKLNEE